MSNVLISLVAALKKSHVLAFENISRTQIEIKEDVHVVDTLLLELQSAFDHEKWQEVIKIGSVLSRPLWVTGKYNLRIKIGKLVEEASAYSNNPEKQSETLIDDLGWTYVALKEYDEATKNIKHGLEIATTINNYVIACKATRHLAGISLRENKIDEAIEYSVKAKEYLNLITDCKIKREMEAGQFYLDSVILKAGKQYTDSLIELGRAASIYQSEKDFDRYSKCLTLQGNIFYEMGEYSKAKDIFRESLAFSKQISRVDQIIENYLGLGKILHYEHDDTEAQKAFQSAFNAAEAIGNKKLANEINQKYLKKGNNYVGNA
jgi:tetratricopeptide (TPR) repeat protein